MADQLCGVTITFSTGFFAEITNLSWDGISRTAVPTSHAGTTGGMTFKPSDLYNAGSLQIQGHFDHDKALITPLTASAATVTITFPLDTGETTASTWTASAFVTDFSWSGGTVDDDAASYSSTLKITGGITIVAAQP
jgi:hypothetical protein